MSVGHHWSLGTYLLPLLFLLVRRAGAGSLGALLAAALVQATTLLEGQHHPFLWQNALIGLWAAFEAVRLRDSGALLAWLACAMLGVALAGIRVVPVLLEFAGYSPSARINGLPPGAVLFSLAAPGQDPGTGGFGIDFAYGSGWWEYTYYVGVAGTLFLVAGAAGALRRETSLLGAGAVALVLGLDTRALGFDAWSWLQHVPIFSSQRGPSRLLVLALFALIFAAAAGWERWLAAARPWMPSRRTVNVVFALLLAVLVIDLVSAARPWQQAAIGQPRQSRNHEVGAPRLIPARAGTVSRLVQTPNQMAYLVGSARPVLLQFPLVLPTQRRGWHADALPITRTPTDHGPALTVEVPGGTTEVHLRYRPPGFVAGATVSLLAVLGVVTALLIGACRRGGRRKPS